METNDFGNNINGRRTLTVADIPAVFSCIHYILGRVPPIVVLETRTVRFHLYLFHAASNYASTTDIEYLQSFLQ
jgi:hypothetical protein